MSHVLLSANQRAPFPDNPIGAQALVEDESSTLRKTAQVAAMS